MLKYISTLLALLALTANNVVAMGEPAEERALSLDQEIAIAKEIFDGKENIFVARVYGLICETCAYGLNIKFSRLKGVDKKRLQKGVELDVYNQFLTIALKPEGQIGVNEIYKAIHAAGYEPKTLFLMDTVDSVIDERLFTVKRSQDIRFELADAGQASLMEHGKEHDLLVVAPAKQAKKVESLKARLIDTVHES